uniref:Zinc transporter ZIP9 n=1 Tax=Spermophilus dauricus TaxID=99837 RepID=A0A8C9PQH8_SPEDA
SGRVPPVSILRARGGCFLEPAPIRACTELQERLKLVTVLGAGLLCGTALAVIVPEGVHALYEDILEGEKREGPYLRYVIDLGGWQEKKEA